MVQLSCVDFGEMRPIQPYHLQRGGVRALCDAGAFPERRGHVLRHQRKIPQQKYIDNSEPGEGLLIFENVVLPFSNPIPNNTQLYKIMTTRLSEVVEL